MITRTRCATVEPQYLGVSILALAWSIDAMQRLVTQT